MRYKRIEDIKDLRNLTWEERMLYDEAIKVYRDNLVTEAYAKEEGYRQAYKDGFEEGRMEVRNEVCRQDESPWTFCGNDSQSYRPHSRRGS